MTISVDTPARTRRSRPPAVGWMVLVSWIALGIQVRATDHGADTQESAAGWFVIGSVLLLLVFRGSRIARGIIVMSSMFGAAIYAFDLFTKAHAALLCATFLGQALPLLTRPVREFVQS